MAQRPTSAELHPGPGFRIKKNITRANKELILQFSEFETPDISDLMNRLYTVHNEIKNLVNDKKIVGSACTVKVFPGDNLMVHKALDIAKPDDIIVVDTSNSPMTAIIGDRIATKAKHRGIAGFVIDGLIRDIAGIKEVNIPVYARGITPIGPLHRGPGEINFPINCGGVVVKPGDIICADENGVVVVRQEISSSLLERLKNEKESLKNYLSNMKKGNFSNEWVDDILNNEGCLFVD